MNAKYHEAENHNPILRILRCKAVLDLTGDSRSSHYAKIADGLMPKPFHIGVRAVGWAEHEIQAFLAARISGQSDSQLRELVTALETQRQFLMIKQAPLGPGSHQAAQHKLQAPRKGASNDS